MIQLTVDSAEIEAFAKQVGFIMQDLQESLPYLVMIDGKESLMAAVRQHCPVGKDIGMHQDTGGGVGVGRARTGGRGHLRDHLAANIVAQGTKGATMNIVQSGNFNSAGRSYLEFIINGTKPSKGRFIPRGGGFRLKRSAQRARQSRVARAKKRYRGFWEQKVSPGTKRGAEMDIGMHPGTHPNNFPFRAYQEWIGRNGHGSALMRVLRRIWGSIKGGIESGIARRKPKTPMAKKALGQMARGLHFQQMWRGPAAAEKAELSVRRIAWRRMWKQYHST